MSPEAQAQEKCIVTVSPHGAFAVGHVFMSMPKLRLEPRFAHFRGRAGAASVLFKVPLLREFLLSLGVREATKAIMDALIRDGCSIALNTGGIWEQVHTDETQEQLVSAHACTHHSAPVQCARLACPPIPSSHCHVRPPANVLSVAVPAE